MPRIAFGLLLGLAALTGCDNGGGSSTVVVVNPSEIQFDVEYNFENGTDVFDWNTPASVARVQIRIRNFSFGQVRLRIFDAVGDLIDDAVYGYFDDFYIVDPDEFYDLRFTQTGQPGLWTIQLDYTDFTGHLYFDATDSANPPPDDLDPEPLTSPLIDASFGASGIAGYAPGNSSGVDLVRDSLGRIVVCGTLIDDVGDRRLAVWRFTAAGVLDSGFGSGGVAILPIDQRSSGRAIAIDGLDRVYATGFIQSQNGDLEAVVCRLGSSGQFDPSFDGDGIGTFGSLDDDVGTGIVVDSLGRIIVSGLRRTLDDTDGNAFVVRLLTNGQFDLTFGTAGVSQTPDPTSRAFDLVQDGFGRFVLCGTVNDDVAAWRFTAGGFLDPTFGIGGIATGGAVAGELRRGLGITLDPVTQSYVIVGFSALVDDETDLTVWRYTANGLADPTFGTNGVSLFVFADAESLGTDVLVDAAGGIIVNGISRSIFLEGIEDGSATLWRFDVNGTPDPLFGLGGFEVYDERPSGVVATAGSGLAFGPGGSILSVGSATDVATGAADLVLYRLLP